MIRINNKESANQLWTKEFIVLEQFRNTMVYRKVRS